MMEYWSDGVLGWWGIGVMGCWGIGALRPSSQHRKPKTENPIPPSPHDSITPPLHHSTTPAPSLRDYLSLAAISAFALVITGYTFGREDHAAYLPFMRHYQDLSLFPGDLLIQTAEHFHTLFWRMMALITNVLPVQPTFFVMHAALVYLTTLAIFRLALTLFHDKPAAYLGVLLLVLPKGMLALDEVALNSAPFLTQTTFVFPFLVLALDFFLRGQRRLAFLLTGIVFNFQGMYAVFVLAMMLTAVLLSAGGRKPRELTALLLIFLLSAAPMLLRVVFCRECGQPPPDPKTNGVFWMDIVRVRLGHHILPSTWPLSAWVKAAVLLLVGVVAFASTWRTQGPTAADRCVLRFALGILVLCILGTVFVEAVPMRQVIQLQLFRSTRFLALLCVLYVAGYARRRFQGDTIERLAAAAAIAFLLFFHYTLLLLLPLLVLFLIPMARRPHSTGQVIECLCSAAVLGASLMWDARNGQWEGRTALFAVASYALFAGCASVALLHRKGSVQSATAFRFACAIALGALLALSAARLRLNYARWDRWTLDPLPNNEAWVEVQQWCKQHTPKDAFFLTPVYLDGFRCFSDRAVWAEFKDGGAHMVNAVTAKEWWNRMGCLHFWGNDGYKDPQLAFAALTGGRLTEIAGRYHASHVVLRKDRPLPLTKLWSNAEFAVYSTR
ncbi:MAG: hypothetical protein FJ279_18345 [Planctomycetes bacterium]|nr:hypothetical protein [Planctomycetota bacterium]